MSFKWGNGFVNFLAFLNFRPFFGPFLGTVVKNLRHQKVAPGISLDFPQKKPSIDIWVLKIIFSKMYISGDQIELEGPVMVSS